MARRAEQVGADHVRLHYPDVGWDNGKTQGGCERRGTLSSPVVYVYVKEPCHPLMSSCPTAWRKSKKKAHAYNGQGMNQA